MSVQSHPPCIRGTGPYLLHYAAYDDCKPHFASNASTATGSEAPTPRESAEEFHPERQPRLRTCCSYPKGIAYTERYFSSNSCREKALCRPDRPWSVRSRSTIPSVRVLPWHSPPTIASPVSSEVGIRHVLWTLCLSSGKIDVFLLCSLMSYNLD